MRARVKYAFTDIETTANQQACTQRKSLYISVHFLWLSNVYVYIETR
jgi:hypothetical protein